MKYSVRVKNIDWLDPEVKEGDVCVELGSSLYWGFCYSCDFVVGERTDIVEKTAAGAVNYMRVARVTNITRAIEELKKAGLWIYGLDMEGASNIYDTDLTGSIGIVVGNEGEGLSRLVKESCDGIIKIPMVGNTESLNAFEG